MSSIKSIIHRMLPEGSNWETPGKGRSKCPEWPPDVFAVAATIVELSGCYAKEEPPTAGQMEHLEEIVKVAEKWRRTWSVPVEVQRRWKQIVDLTVEPADDKAANKVCWKPAMYLLAVADAASIGIGFFDDVPPEKRFLGDRLMSHVADIAMQGPEADSVKSLSAEGKKAVRFSKRLLPHVPHSITSMVPCSEVCVQPKSRTAQVGCTLRSLSHHLALLPPVGEVATSWRPLNSANDRVVNLLLVPFPFQLQAESFRPLRSDPVTGSYFGVDQRWLQGWRKNGIKKMIAELIQAAEADGGKINGVVFPEMALNLTVARDMAAMLAREFEIDLFVAGVWDARRKQNAAYTCVYAKAKRGRRSESWTQPKHHRWCVEKGQLERYGLSHILDAGRRWWEETRLGEREVHLCEFRSGASLAVLICEDLARVDPAQRILRAVGSNLVIALLMDGPQTQGRWSTRAAMALADDPGSSVLSLTCLGMVRRWEEVDARRKKASISTQHVVAMWKEPPNAPVELKLPDDCHALRLSLAPEVVKQDETAVI